MTGQGPTVGPAPDRDVIVKGVVIPDLLDLQDTNETLVYWMLRRYYTGFPTPVVDSLVEPIRVKVASTQDLSLLTEDELRTAQSINNLYNTDVTDLVFSVNTYE